MALVTDSTAFGLWHVNGAACFLALIVTALLHHFRRPSSKLPMINAEQGSIWSRGYRARQKYAEDLPNLVQAGLRKANAFRIAGPDGINVILSPTYLNQICNHPALHLEPVAGEELNSHIAGFEVFAQLGSNHIISDVVRTKLTRRLAKLPHLLSSEASMLLKDQWTDNTDWHEVQPRETSLHILSRLASLIFVGEEVGRNPDWSRILVSYNVEVFAASNELKLWPKPLRPLVARFKPSCRQLRRYIREARAILEPHIESRLKATEKGGEKKEYQDVITWLEAASRNAGQPYDPVLAQMMLAAGAFQTSSDLLAQVLLDLSARKDWDTLVEELRQEILSALNSVGWAKTSLNDLKLLDSVLKETQRLKPASTLVMPRYASEQINLADGTIIPKGSTTYVANVAMRDPKIYPDPDTFDPYRFLKAREAGDSSAYLVSTSPEHIGFGLGRYECPGRFFVANNIKLVLCHMLLNYDIKKSETCSAAPITCGIRLESNPDARIVVRRRQEEIFI